VRSGAVKRPRNQADKVLAKSMGGRLIHALRLQRKQGLLIAKGSLKAAMIWELLPQKDAYLSRFPVRSL
jgi:hypothetical protein